MFIRTDEDGNELVLPQEIILEITTLASNDPRRPPENITTWLYAVRRIFTNRYFQADYPGREGESGFRVFPNPRHASQNEKMRWGFYPIEDEESCMITISDEHGNRLVGEKLMVCLSDGCHCFEPLGEAYNSGFVVPASIVETLATRGLKLVLLRPSYPSYSDA